MKLCLGKKLNPIPGDTTAREKLAEALAMYKKGIAGV